MAGLATPNVRKVMSAAQSYNGGGIPARAPGVTSTPGTQAAGGITPVTPWGTASQVTPGVTAPYFDPSAGPTGALVNPTGGGSIVEHDLNMPSGGGGGSRAVSVDLGGAGGGGGAAPNGGGVDTGAIMDLISKLKGDQVPRESAPSAPAHVGAPTPSAQAPSSSLGFARYKDQSGRIGAAALRAMKDTMSGRGLADSSLEADEEANIIGQVARGQGDAAYAQQRAAEDQAWQASQMGYQGDITQRAQDLGLSTSGYQGGITQRGQDMQTNDLTNLAPSLLSLMFRSGSRIY